MGDVIKESVALYGAPVRAMSVVEFYRAAEEGIFNADERLELIWGEVVPMSPQRSAHAWATTNLRDKLAELFPVACIREHSPLSLDDHTEPEPDILVAVGPGSRYVWRHPDAADVLLVVEVADSSLRKDRELKSKLYAGSGIREYWILDLNSNRLEVYREPTIDGARYEVAEVFAAGESVAPIYGGDGRIEVGALLPE